MKIAITGHTTGIGKAIFENFSLAGHNCLGFSRSNGYDISSKESRSAILSQSLSCDIFVNNATTYKDDSQLRLLTGIYEIWKNDTRKIIINLSSRAGDLIHSSTYPYPAYAKQKFDLDQFCESQMRGPWIINLKPGFVDTESVAYMNDPTWPKMNVCVLPKIIEFCLDNQMHFKVKSMTFQL